MLKLVLPHTPPGHWTRNLVSRVRQFEARIKQRRYVGTYVAITGSCGKTTTTMLIEKMLADFGSTKMGKGANYGSDLLRTVRKLKQPVDFVVQEAGAHRPGTLDSVKRAFVIDVGVITSVGHDHGAQYRGVPGRDIPDAIAREKRRIVEGVRAGGLTCLNADDPRVLAMAAHSKAKVVTFGRSETADVRAINVDARWPNGMQFDLLVGGKTHHVSTRFVGTLMLTNVLGALSVIHGLSLDLNRAIATLGAVEPVRDRMGVHRGRDGKTYILDTEKAPHWSTALLLADLPSIGTREMTFVLGEMSDIRNDSGKKYRQVLRSLCQQVEQVVATARAADYVEKLRAEGISNLVAAPTAIDVARYLDTRPPGLVFLKSNKSAQLWRVLDQVSLSAPEGNLREAARGRSS